MNRPYTEKMDARGAICLITRRRRKGGIGLTMMGGLRSSRRDSRCVPGNLHIEEDEIVPCAGPAYGVHEHGAAAM